MSSSTAADPLDGRGDQPKIVAPGPVITSVALLVGLGLDRLFWIGAIAGIQRFWRAAFAAALIGAGAWLLLHAVALFRRAGTPFEPWRPSTVLATGSLYARTRNPMYQGFLLCFAGLAVLLRSDWGLLMMVPAALAIHYGVVLREEAYLTRKFGEPFRAYMQAVPRWGLPFGRPRV
jgi:protein-S-isoprenylcysteine O-methyltransferase Ste14